MNKYTHKEAFCLMWYRCNCCNHRERIWNSRDGVTPFGMNCPSCGEPEMYHVNWHLDECIPEYRPFPGQRMWISMTRERAEELTWRSIRRAKRNGMPENEEAVFQSVFDNIWKNGTAPDIVIEGYTKDKEVFDD